MSKNLEIVARLLPHAVISRNMRQLRYCAALVTALMDEPEAEHLRDRFGPDLLSLFQSANHTEFQGRIGQIIVALDLPVRYRMSTAIRQDLVDSMDLMLNELQKSGELSDEDLIQIVACIQLLDLGDENVEDLLFKMMEVDDLLINDHDMGQSSNEVHQLFKRPRSGRKPGNFHSPDNSSQSPTKLLKRARLNYF